MEYKGPKSKILISWRAKTCQAGFHIRAYVLLFKTLVQETDWKAQRQKVVYIVVVNTLLLMLCHSVFPYGTIIRDDSRKKRNTRKSQTKKDWVPQCQISIFSIPSWSVITKIKCRNKWYHQNIPTHLKIILNNNFSIKNCCLVKRKALSFFIVQHFFFAEHVHLKQDCAYIISKYIQ